MQPSHTLCVRAPLALRCPSTTCSDARYRAKPKAKRWPRGAGPRGFRGAGCTVSTNSWTSWLDSGVDPGSWGCSWLCASSRLLQSLHQKMLKRLKRLNPSMPHVSWHVLLLLLGVQQCIVTGEANLRRLTKKAQLGSGKTRPWAFTRKTLKMRVVQIKC